MLWRMDERIDTRRKAMLHLAARRRRVTGLRRRVVWFSVAVFIVAWALVFGQMATGNDPVLKSSQAQASRQSAPAQQAPAEPQPQPTQVVVDPVTGQAYEVPAGSATIPTPDPAPAPDPAPVITSQS
jgi:hypothetical protein